MKNIHLRCCPCPASVQRTSSYASFRGPSGALQPVGFADLLEASKEAGRTFLISLKKIPNHDILHFFQDKRRIKAAFDSLLPPAPLNLLPPESGFQEFSFQSAFPKIDPNNPLNGPGQLFSEMLVFYLPGDRPLEKVIPLSSFF